MKLISWNVNARKNNVAKQVIALSQQEPHVVALQDVRITALAQYEHAFAEIIKFCLKTVHCSKSQTEEWAWEVTWELVLLSYYCRPSYY